MDNFDNFKQLSPERHAAMLTTRAHNVNLYTAGKKYNVTRAFSAMLTVGRLRSGVRFGLRCSLSSSHKKPNSSCRISRNSVLFTTASNTSSAAARGFYRVLNTRDCDFVYKVCCQTVFLTRSTRYFIILFSFSAIISQFYLTLISIF